MHYVQSNNDAIKHSVTNVLKRSNNQDALFPHDWWITLIWRRNIISIKAVTEEILRVYDIKIHKQRVEGEIKKKVSFNSAGYDSLLIAQASVILLRNQLRALPFLLTSYVRNEIKWKYERHRTWCMTCQSSPTSIDDIITKEWYICFSLKDVQRKEMY